MRDHRGDRPDTRALPKLSPRYGAALNLKSLPLVSQSLLQKFKAKKIWGEALRTMQHE